MPSRNHRAAADEALTGLIVEIDSVLEQLDSARRQAREIDRLRRIGHSWYAIVEGKEGPLIVERITRAMASLGGAGGRWRREQAAALHAEGVGVKGIAALFGVTRQRVAALLQK